jgi:hypothetical protein
LGVPGALLDDAGLRVLLAHMPVLTYVSVTTVQLQDSHADVECSWEELRMDDVSVTSLAHLPLRGIKHVRVNELVSAATAGGGDGVAAAAAYHTAAATKLSAALAAAPDCTFVSCYEEHIMPVRCSVAEMPALLPLLARWQGVKDLYLTTPSGQRLTPAAVAALGALLEGMPSCKELTIEGPTPHPSALLLPVLSRTSVSKVFFCHDHMAEAHLMLWCAGGRASHPVALELRHGCEFVGDIRLVRSAVDERDSGVVLEDNVESDADLDDDVDFEDEE